MGQAAIESDGINVFVLYNGVRVAKRSHSGTPLAGTWMSLEPGYTVRAPDRCFRRPCLLGVRFHPFEFLQR